MAAMRIAIAGSGGLSQHLAHFINQSAHYFIILSRAPKPRLMDLGYQVAVVDYDDLNDLTYALKGVDLVISTIAGNAQINLIDAASRAEVRRFVPSEFEGPPNRRAPDDYFDRGRASAIEFLRVCSRKAVRNPMQFTSFTCGVFYERFSLGGLASKGIALGTPFEKPGSYLIDITNNVVECVEEDAQGQHISLCMTSVSDVARFVVAALEFNVNHWPSEWRMRGDRLTVTEIIEYAEAIKGVQFSGNVYSPADLALHLQHAKTYQDGDTIHKLQALVSTLERHYDYSSTNLNDRVTFRPINFWDWLSRHWAPPQASEGS